MTFLQSDRMRKVAAFRCVFLFALCLRVNPAWAQEELSDSEVQARLQNIHQMLEQGELKADLWWNGWLIGYGAATLVQGGIGAASHDKTTRQDMFLGAATTGLGVAGQLLTPMASRNAPDRLSRLPETTPEERRQKLFMAEKILQESASDERAGRSWKTHAITGAVNLAGGLIVWRGFQRSFGEGLLNFALNTAVTEIQIFTQPTRAIKDDDAYQKKYPFEADLGCNKPDRNWFVTLYPGGIGIRVEL